MWPDTNTTGTRIILCHNLSEVTALAAHNAGKVAVLSAHPNLPGLRAWWPLIEQCTDSRLASAAAHYLTADLPSSLRLVVPEATTLLAGALHAASLVDWPIVTLTHLLDGGEIPTIVELLAGSGEEEFALDVAAAAGRTAPDAAQVVHAAALAAHHLDRSRAMITGSDRRAELRQRMHGGPDERVPVLCVHDDRSPVAALVAARLRHLAEGDPVLSFIEKGTAA